MKCLLLLLLFIAVVLAMRCLIFRVLLFYFLNRIMRRCTQLNYRPYITGSYLLYNLKVY